MKIELGQTGDYAVRSVLALARAGKRLKAREIAAEMALPEKFLPQILALLIKTGIVGSAAGPDGGYELRRPAGDITLLDVIEAAEGPVRSTKCVLRGGPCRMDGTCAIHEPWAEAQGALAAKLGRTTFAEIRRAALRKSETGPAVRATRRAATR